MTAILLQLESFHKSNLKSATGTRGAMQPPATLLMNDRYEAADPRVLADEKSVNTIKRDGSIDAWDTHEPVEEISSTECVTNNDGWLSEEIQEEVQKLERVANQLDEVVKPEKMAKIEQPSQQLDRVAMPEMKANLEQLEWEIQQIGQVEVDLKPLDIESAEQLTRIPSRSPTSVATIILPTKAFPGIIPPKQLPPVRDRNMSMCNV